MISPDQRWSRRDFLRTAAAAGLSTSIPKLVRAKSIPESTVTISILHTTDLHGHILPTFDYNGNPDMGGFARCATQIRRWRRQNRNSVLIDVGDVYQGTDVSLRNRGELMIDLFNYFKYDAWVIGNHEFDWGIDVFRNALEKSDAAVLATNVSIEGMNDFPNSKNSFGRIQPFIIKEFEGVKVAVIGITTPGMTFWFQPEFIRGLDFRNPIEPVRRAITEAKSQGANAIVLAGHMGLKLRSGGDDFANMVTSLTSEFPEAAVFIAGHTHQLVPSRMTNESLLTQADHFGIYVGRVDLIFDRETKQLVDRQARCELMDSRVHLDRTVLSRAKPQLEQSNAALAEPIGELAETLHARSRPGIPSDIEWLIGAAIAETLEQRQVAIDGVFHGVFDENGVLFAGKTTVNDIWRVIPYENFLVTAALTPEEIKAVMEEAYASHEGRNLIGFEIITQGRGIDRRIVSLSLSDGRRLEYARRYTIAFNSFDSRSGGHHFMKLRMLLEQPETRCTLHPVQTRDALIEYFRRHGIVQRMTLAAPPDSVAA